VPFHRFITQNEWLGNFLTSNFSEDYYWYSQYYGFYYTVNGEVPPWRFPHMGPQKIVARLAELHPDINWPAPSTIGDVLRRAN
jgi:hypothetical protein